MAWKCTHEYRRASPITGNYTHIFFWCRICQHELPLRKHYRVPNKMVWCHPAPVGITIREGDGVIYGGKATEILEQRKKKYELWEEK